MNRIIKKDLIYPDLSYKIVGLLFNIFDEIGYGHKEKYYENALELSFKKEGLRYKKQLYAPLFFEGKLIGKYYLDYLVEDIIVIELKQGNRFSRKHIDQVYSYLKVNNLQLGILVQFTPNGVMFKRIVNIH